ncbi:MAG: nucleotide exchange factor GrpE [Alphaproteobacteria bacterium]|nr:nucleotide exchange factor GrpE [Alphaproteobacteria bacterium]
MSSDTPDPGTPANDSAPAGAETGGQTADARIAELEAEVVRLKDQALRALAEAENTRRRAQREIEDNNKYAVANFARDVLPLADNLRRALDTLTPEERAANEKLEKFAQGIELVEREFLATLDRHHVKRVDPLGQAFDHNLHQAVMQLEAADKPPGTVVQVLQPGYTIHGRLLRPAMVVVAKGGQAGSSGGGIDTTA